CDPDPFMRRQAGGAAPSWRCGVHGRTHDAEGTTPFVTPHGFLNRVVESETMSLPIPERPSLELDSVAIGIDEHEGTLPPAPLFRRAAGLQALPTQMGIELIEVGGRELQMEATRAELDQAQPCVADAKQREFTRAMVLEHDAGEPQV